MPPHTPPSAPQAGLDQRPGRPQAKQSYSMRTKSRLPHCGGWRRHSPALGKPQGSSAPCRVKTLAQTLAGSHCSGLGAGHSAARHDAGGGRQNRRLCQQRARPLSPTLGGLADEQPPWGPEGAGRQPSGTRRCQAGYAGKIMRPDLRARLGNLGYETLRITGGAAPARRGSCLTETANAYTLSQRKPFKL